MKEFGRLLEVLAPFRKWFALAVLLSFLTVASSVALVATSAYLISRAALVAEVAQVSIAITCVRVFAILRGTFRYLERLVSHTVTFRVLAELRGWFFAAVEPLAPACLGGHRSGDLLARSVADVETLESFYVRVLVPPVAAAMVAAFTCVLLGAFAWQLAVAVLIFLVATGLALPLAMQRLGARSSAELIIERAQLNSVAVDQVQGLRDLLVFDQQGEYAARLLSSSQRLNRIQERTAVLRGAGEAASTLLVALALLGVLWLAIPLVTGGEIEAVYLALLPLAAVAGFEAVQSLGPALQQLRSSQEAGRRIFDLVDAPPPVREPDHPAPLPRDLSIEVRDLTFRYDLERPAALDRVSFSLRMGERLAIVGPSGAGKSTNASLLLRFWQHEEGEITHGGRDLREYRSEDVRSLIAVVPQDVHLFNATVRDNLLLADPDAGDEQLEAACRQALLHDFIAGLPHGYDTLIGENGVLLSGGERQRIAIARVIVKGSPLVILDEPTANLDARTERKLMASLEPFLAERTVLVMSHRRAPIVGADRVLRCEAGRLANQVQASARAAVVRAAGAPERSPIRGGGPA